MPKQPCILGYIQVNHPGELIDCRRGRRDSTAQTAITQARIEEIGKLHRYTANQLAASLAVAQAESQAARCAPGLTPVQQAALQQLRREYLWALLTAVNKVGLSMIDDLGHGQPLPQISAEQRRRIDQIVQMYLQHVKTILRR